MKRLFILLIAFLMSTSACNNGKKAGEKVVVCPDEPLKGILKLKVEKILTIDSLTVDDENPPIFNGLMKDKNDSIYISNIYPGIAVYKFAKDGSFSKKFLSKGEGPGELRSLQFLQYVDDRIIMGSENKIIEYDLDGNYIAEKRLKKFYPAITMIDKQYFIATHQKTENKIVKRICSIINKNDENEIFKLLETGRRNIGKTIVGEGEMTLSISLAGITPDYITRYNASNDLIYQCLSDEPDIYIKNRNGDLIKIVKTNFKNWVLTEDDKNEVMKSFFRYPDDMKNMVKKSLPEKMLVIESLLLLPKGYFAVYFHKNWEEQEIRVFDKEGQFQYIVEFPEELSGRSTKFTKNGFACIEREEDRDLYVEYKITN
ncbi:MAG: 6-bladed beta-propeller, partial [Candidatus Aminicenantes bacterium]|nr:6-bladed beta-propeller [Candidatus Aminicenantes bacterium]